MAEAGIENTRPKPAKTREKTAFCRDAVGEMVPAVVPSEAIQAWAAIINGDERLHDLMMYATAMDPEELVALLAIQRGMLSARKAVQP